MQSISDYFSKFSPEWDVIPHRCDSLDGWLIYEPRDTELTQHVDFLAWKRLPECNLGLCKKTGDHKHLFVTIFVPGAGEGDLMFTQRNPFPHGEFRIIDALKEVEMKLVAFFIKQAILELAHYSINGGRIN